MPLFTDQPEAPSPALFLTERNPSSTTNTSVPRYLAREGVKIAAISGTVAAGLCIPDYVMHLAHSRKNVDVKKNIPILDTSHHRSLIRFAAMSAAAKAVITLYKTTLPAAVTKNSVISQRENVQEIVTFAPLKESGQTQPNTMNKKNSNSKTSTTMTQMVAVSGIIGTIDTVTGQWQANKRKYKMELIRNPSYDAPCPMTRQERIKFFKLGLGIRTVSNFLPVLGLFATPVTANFISEYTPSNTQNTINWSTGGAIAINAAMFGPASNLCSLLHTRQILSANPQSIKTQSVLSVALDLAKKEGIKGFFRGYPASIAYTGFTYILIPFAETSVAEPAVRLTEKSYEKIRAMVSARSNRFFHRATTTQNNTADDIKIVMQHFTP